MQVRNSSRGPQFGWNHNLIIWKISPFLCNNKLWGKLFKSTTGSRAIKPNHDEVHSKNLRAKELMTQSDHHRSNIIGWSLAWGDRSYGDNNHPHYIKSIIDHFTYSLIHTLKLLSQPFHDLGIVVPTLQVHLISVVLEDHSISPKFELIWSSHISLIRHQCSIHKPKIGGDWMNLSFDVVEWAYGTTVRTCKINTSTLNLINEWENISSAWKDEYLKYRVLCVI